MAKVVREMGPLVNQEPTVAPAAVNDISISIVDRGGPIMVRGMVKVSNNTGATRNYNAALRKNGVQVASTVQEAEVATLLQEQIFVEQFDPAAAVGDVWTLEINTDTQNAANLVLGSRSWLSIEAYAPDGAVCAGVRLTP